MTTRPAAGLRRRVIDRAGNRCEYCRLHQDFAATAHQVDHVIAEKHAVTLERSELIASGQFSM
jgi:hypothetical protein